MSTLLETLLEERDVLLADGATGTNLFALGLPHGEAPEVWNLEEPGQVRAHYRSFIVAGSDIVLTNTFGGTANRLKLHGLDDRVHEVNRVAAELLAAEIDKEGRKIVLAGSVGPTGDLFEPLGPLTHGDGVAAFAAQMQGLKDGGADVAWIETMSSEDELHAALEAADEVGLKACCTLSFDTNGRTMMGVTPSRLAELVGALEYKPIGYGGNCGTGATDLLAGLLSMREKTADGDVLIAKANCGIPEFIDGAIRYNGTPELMADFTKLARNLGARIIGGCCGTTAEHVRVMRDAIDEGTRGEVPDLAGIIAKVGALTGSTADLFAEAGDQRVGSRHGRRRRAAKV
jgi:methionine synthase I (cobalamin-dependent)